MALEKSTRMEKLVLDVRRGFVAVTFSVVVKDNGEEIASRTGEKTYENSPAALARMDADLPAALALRIKQIMGWT